MKRVLKKYVIPHEGKLLVYSNDPFVNAKHCDLKGLHINGPSDSALFGGLSHEHIESVTDPEPNYAWTDFVTGETTGYEIGDKCGSEFCASLGEVEVGGKKIPYNQEINGHRYLYQQEWSNKGHTCLQRLEFKASEAPAATFTTAPVSGRTVKFDAAGSAAGANVRYVWRFNDQAGEKVETNELSINHTFSAVGSYPVALTVMMGDGTSKAVAKQVAVAEKTQTLKFTSTAPSSVSNW